MTKLYFLFRPVLLVLIFHITFWKSQEFVSKVEGKGIIMYSTECVLVHQVT